MNDTSIIEQFTAGKYIFTIAQMCSGSEMPDTPMVRHVQDVIRKELTTGVRTLERIKEELEEAHRLLRRIETTYERTTP